MLALFTAAIFLGAFLLFLIQPMAGRMLLPLYGGAPAVWNAAMVFYQAALLAGYSYAHWSTRRFGKKPQIWLYLVLLCLPFLALPVSFANSWIPPSSNNPVLSLLGQLAVAVGLPFFVVSATSPLLQRWFSQTSHPAAADPYFLYAASNAGSLLALLLYPTVIEPILALHQQSAVWTSGYLLLAALVAVCGFRFLASAPRPAPEVITIPAPVPKRRPKSKASTKSSPSLQPVTWPRRTRWILLALVPNSLMLSVTTYVTTEIAPIPLFWVLSLGLYLLTFTLAFGRRQRIPLIVWARLLPFLVLPLMLMLAATLAVETVPGVGWIIALNFAGLFVVARFCHGTLAADRPEVSRLTEFYLWISVGGVLGGIFNVLLAPLIFPGIYEYPLTLLLACLLLPVHALPAKLARRARILDFVLPALLAALICALVAWVHPPSPVLLSMLYYLLPLGLGLCFMGRPMRFALGSLALLLATLPSFTPGYHTSQTIRNFFGILRMQYYSGNENFHILTNGTTWHGLQSFNPLYQLRPMGYYTHAGPLGQVFSLLPLVLQQRVAVVGLGAGTIAAYAGTGEHWTFYDINPADEAIARDPRDFTYLHDSLASIDVVLGDGRLSLQSARDGEFGLILLDAYNSDSVPIHLLTREALALYLQKLRPDGVLLFHLSNHHLNLEPVLASLAQDARLPAFVQHDLSDQETFNKTGRLTSDWLIMTRNPTVLKFLAEDSRWHPPITQPGLRLWTDDYASVFPIIRWN